MTEELREELEEESVFLNVDLELVGEASFDPLIEALGERVMVLHQTDAPPFRAHLELGVGECLSLEETVRGLLDLIEGLEPGSEAEGLYRGCTQRTFSVGLQGGLGPHAMELSISAATLARVAAAGGELGITLYGTRTRYAVESSAL